MLSKKDRSSLAGEFFTLAELYRRGYNAFITLGKGKQIDIVVKNDDDSLSVEVKARMSTGQFLCTYPPSPKIKKIWVFVDMNKKIDEPPDFYVLSAADLFKLGKERETEIKVKEGQRNKPYAKFASCDVTLKNLKKYTKGWQLLEDTFKNNVST